MAGKHQNPNKNCILNRYRCYFKTVGYVGFAGTSDHFTVGFFKGRLMAMSVFILDMLIARLAKLQAPEACLQCRPVGATGPTDFEQL